MSNQTTLLVALNLITRAASYRSGWLLVLHTMCSPPIQNEGKFVVTKIFILHFILVILPIISDLTVLNLQQLSLCHMVALEIGLVSNPSVMNQLRQSRASHVGAARSKGSRKKK